VALNQNGSYKKNKETASHSATRVTVRARTSHFIQVNSGLKNSFCLLTAQPAKKKKNKDVPTGPTPSTIGLETVDPTRPHHIPLRLAISHLQPERLDFLFQHVDHPDNRDKFLGGVVVLERNLGLTRTHAARPAPLSGLFMFSSRTTLACSRKWDTLPPPVGRCRVLQATFSFSLGKPFILCAL
jgi:hypothetical protein